MNLGGHPAERWVDELWTERELNAMLPGSVLNDDEEMNREDAKRYRGIAARLNYLSRDRMDIGFAVKEAAPRGPRGTCPSHCSETGPSSTRSVATWLAGRGS